MPPIPDHHLFSAPGGGLLKDIFARVRPYTYSRVLNIHTICQSVKYLESHAIPGAFVEFGVWRGGASMAAALKLMALGNTGRDFYLYDTYAGMPEPGTTDRLYADPHLDLKKYRSDRALPGGANGWHRAGLEEVQRNMSSTGYPEEKIHYIKGCVTETLPARAPDQIAWLRLDTDFFESTAHELEHLFPRVSRHGIIIVDDYDSYQGCREAVDDYVRRNGLRIFWLTQGDSGRVAVKL